LTEPPPRIEAEAPLGNGQLILIAEDEPYVRDSTQFLLESLHYSVLATANGQEALQCYAERGQEIALVLSDLIMPGISGMELCEQLLAQSPALRMAIMSGYPLEQSMDTLCVSHIYALLIKPFSRLELARAVQQALSM
jgi:CheY-like chemotaxis protein